MVAFEKERITKRKHAAEAGEKSELDIEDVELVQLEKKTSLNEYLSQPNDKLDEFVQLTPVEANPNVDSDDPEEAARAAAQEDLR